jgi:hypothetical protein
LKDEAQYVLPFLNESVDGEKVNCHVRRKDNQFVTFSQTVSRCTDSSCSSAADHTCYVSLYPECRLPVSNWVMRNKASNGIAIILLIASTALYGNRTVLSIVSASHLVRHGDEVRESRVHLMRDHKLYVEEIIQQSSSQPTCKMSRAVLPQPAFQQIKKLMESQQFRAIQTPQDRTEIKPGQDEIWRMVFRDGRTQFFSFTPPQSRPPTSFVAWFEKARRVQPSENIPVKSDS